MITVALADDQSLIRMGLRVVIDAEDDLSLVGEAEDGYQIVDLVAAHHPDVVLMDIRMPRRDGLEALSKIKADPALADTKVVMLTTFELDEYVFEALNSGASGFLIKDNDPTEFVRAIRAAAEGESLLSPSVTRRVISSFTSSRPAQHKPHPLLGELTEREREVLCLVGEGLNNDEIADRLVVSPATARTHVSRTMVKLQARDRAQLVVIAYQAGLVD